MNSLFVETSAKTAVGVHEAFLEVVEKILDTPELWAPVGAASSSRREAGQMPGMIELGKVDGDAGDGCQC